MALMTQEQFDAFTKTADLNDEKVRRIINNTVINRAAKTRWRRQHWETNFAPIDTSHVEYLRPCPIVVLGQDGWKIIANRGQWFCD